MIKSLLAILCLVAFVLGTISVSTLPEDKLSGSPRVYQAIMVLTGCVILLGLLIQ